MAAVRFIITSHLFNVSEEPCGEKQLFCSKRCAETEHYRTSETRCLQFHVITKKKCKTTNGRTEEVSWLKWSTVPPDVKLIQEADLSREVILTKKMVQAVKWSKRRIWVMPWSWSKKMVQAVKWSKRRIWVMPWSWSKKLAGSSCEDDLRSRFEPWSDLRRWFKI